MPVKKIRFAQPETGRTAAPSTPMVTKDWEFLNFTPEIVVNPLTQAAEVWASTFTGTTAAHAPNIGGIGRMMVWSGNSNAIVSASGWNDTVTFAVNATNIGGVTLSSGGGLVLCSALSETKINGTAIAVFIVHDANPNPDTVTGYYFASDAGVAGTTFTGDTHTNTTIDSIASTAGMYSGQTITGSGIAANTRILSVDSSTAITTDTATTATAAGVTITRSAIAKIIDAQFPPNQTPALTIVGNMVHKDGYAFVACSNGTLWNSDLNSLTSWTATGYVSADSKPDSGVGLALINDIVVMFGSNSIEFFQNAGLASGSPLQKIPNMTIDAGVYNALFSVSSRNYGDHVFVTDGVIYFIVNTTHQGSGEVGVYKMERAGTIKKISYGSLDKLIAQATVSSYDVVFNGSGVMNGTKFVSLHITGEGQNYDYFYYPSSGLWWRQNVHVVSMVGNQGITYFASGTSIVKTSLTTRFSGTATIRCGMDDYGTNARKSVEKITVIGDRKATSANSTMTLYSDDYSTTASSQSVDLSVVRPAVTRCGAGYNLAPEFSDADTQHVRIRGFDVKYREGV